MNDVIKHFIISALQAEGISSETLAESSFVVEHPADLAKGDYSTNVALVFSKMLKKNPVELANALVAHLQKMISADSEGAVSVSDIQKVEVAGPGFINFFLAPTFFDKQMKEVLGKGAEYGSLDVLAGKKYFVEYTQPNPFKDFHIGHLMNNIIGESLSRMLEKNGAEVRRATYHGDVGLHVAKAIFGLQSLKEEITITSLGKAYAYGNKEYEENEDAKKIITDINKKVYEKSDKEINALYEKGREVSLSYFETMYARLGSTFDYHFYESDAGKEGKEIVESFVGSVFEKSEGAVVFKGEEYGLHTRVFLNAQGLPTYEAKEVGLAQIKKQTYPYDRSLTVTANEQDDFFKVVEVAIGKVFPELEGKLSHVPHGMLKLTTGKMSSRTGSVISVESFINEVVQTVIVKMNEAERENISEDEKPALAESIALAALKYWILKQSIGKDIIFDKDKALSLEGDSGPYLQYAHTRALSALRKAEGAGIAPDSESGIPFSEPSEIELSKKICRFPEVIEEATKIQAPQQLVTYLTELASVFNHFYAVVTIVNKEDELSGKRVALVSAFATVLKNGLETLGISVPEKM